MKSTDSCKKTRVTISIPQEAGENLMQLAKLNTQLLNELGILSVQIDGAKSVLDVMQSSQCPDPQTKSITVASWKTNDIMPGYWRHMENIYSQVTPAFKRIHRHSKDLLRVPYLECLSPASANLCMPNERFSSCRNIAFAAKSKIPKVASGFVIENEQRQRCTAKSSLHSSKPQSFPLQMSSYCGTGYHPPELPATGIIASIHSASFSNCLPVACVKPFGAKVRPLRQKRKKFSSVEKLQEEVDQAFVPEAVEVKVCFPGRTLSSNNNVLPVTRPVHLDSNLGHVEKSAFKSMTNKALEKKDSSLTLTEIDCARKLNLTENKSDSGETTLDIQVSGEMKKLNAPVLAGDSSSARDPQLTDLNSFPEILELNCDFKADRSETDETDNGSIEKVAISLNEDLSCVTSGQLDPSGTDILLPLAVQLSSGSCTVMEKLSNLPLKEVEPLLEEPLQCVVATDASQWVSETQQLPEASVNLVLANDVASVATASVDQDDDGLKLPINSPASETFAQSSKFTELITIPQVSATLTSLPSELSQVGIREESSANMDPVCLDWSGLSDEDIKVIKLNNRQSALDLHSPHFEELSVCSTKSLPDDLRQLKALVVCEFDSLAVKASSLLCVTKLTDRAPYRLQSKKVRFCESTEMPENVGTKRKRNGHLCVLEKDRIKRKTGRDVPMLNEDHSYLNSDDLNAPLVSVPSAKR